MEFKSNKKGKDVTGVMTVTFLNFGSQGEKSVSAFIGIFRSNVGNVPSQYLT